MVLTIATPFGVISAMELKAFIKSLGDESQRKAFAERCGSTIGHVRNVMYGFRPCSAELAAAIERESGKVVTRRELCPANWQVIWPELSEAA